MLWLFKRRDPAMTLTVEIGEAKARLSELVAKVEAGEEVVIARGDGPVGRLMPMEVDRGALVMDAIETIRALRARARPVTVEEILSWKHEGHRS